MTPKVLITPLAAQPFGPLLHAQATTDNQINIFIYTPTVKKQ
jgi:hypothetical protein